MRTTKEILADVVKLLDGKRSVTVDIRDPAYESLVVQELSRAKTRLLLSHEGIAVEFPMIGSTELRIYKLIG
jgi:C4-type Zn-finger protein